MPQKILIIDDSPQIHALMKARLKDEAIAVHSADSGLTGLALATELQPDVILLDVNMPSMDGYEVCRRLKASPVTSAAPIIFLTGADSTEDKIKGLELGATDYITKPFDPAEMRARVRAALRTAYLLDLLSRKAMIDGLTGLWNRGYLDARLMAEVALARRSGRALSCIMLDVDRFKGVNDKYGHPFGDDVLKMVASMLNAGSRTEDVVCRYGGEEFAILLPNTARAGAVELADRMRLAIATQTLRFRDQTVNVTCSMGVAEVQEGDEDGSTMLETADSALYQAKQTGRNRVCTSNVATPVAA
jgi:diguanylate cyclase (GGDEF)-like protein